jgi:RNA polymerase sigma factor (sigma-70 family)
MNVFAGKYPPSLRKAVSHAARLHDLLRRLEEGGAAHGIIGRAGELRVVLRATLGEWRTGRSAAPETRNAIVSYLDTLHRAAGKTLRSSPTLECCRLDDAVTSGPSPAAVSFAVSVALSAPPGAAPDSTEKQGWADNTEILARFHAEAALVDQQARALRRRIPASTATLDDLCTFGLEGLLDAARRFDPARGVPFAHWARLRIHSAMIDGVRLAQNRRRDPTAIAVAHAPELASDSPEDLLASAQERALLPALLASLPQVERQLLEQYYFAGQSLAQAASALGLPTSTASRLHARALHALRRQLLSADTP